MAKGGFPFPPKGGAKGKAKGKAPPFPKASSAPPPMPPMPPPGGGDGGPPMGPGFSRGGKVGKKRK